MTSMRRLFNVLLALVPASLAIATLAGNVREVRADEPPAIKATYDKLCKSCHGEDGKGVAKKATTLKIDAKLLDFSREEATKMTADEKKKILADGKEKMPAFSKKLAPTDVDPILAYVDSLTKK